MRHRQCEYGSAYQGADSGKCGRPHDRFPHAADSTPVRSGVESRISKSSPALWASRPDTTIRSGALHFNIGIANQFPSPLDEVMVVPAQPEHVVGARGPPAGSEDDVMDLADTRSTAVEAAVTVTAHHECPQGGRRHARGGPEGESTSLMTASDSIRQAQRPVAASPRARCGPVSSLASGRSSPGPATARPSQPGSPPHPPAMDPITLTSTPSGTTASRPPRRRHSSTPT